MDLSFNNKEVVYGTLTKVKIYKYVEIDRTYKYLRKICQF